MRNDEFQVRSEVLQALTPAQVLRVYSGRPGCMCGCRGNYYCQNDGGDPRGEKKSSALVIKVLRTLQVQDVVFAGERDLDGRAYVFADVGRRHYVAYLADGVEVPR